MDCKNTMSPNFCGLVRFSEGLAGRYAKRLNTSMIKTYSPSRYTKILKPAVEGGKEICIPCGAEIELVNGEMYKGLSADSGNLGSLLPFEYIDRAIVKAEKEGAATLELNRYNSSCSVEEALKAYHENKIDDIDGIFHIVEG